MLTGDDDDGGGDVGGEIRKNKRKEHLR